MEQAQPAIEWTRKKYSIGHQESVVDIFEKEFNCKMIWAIGRCYLEFKDSRSYTWFVLRWT